MAEGKGYTISLAPPRPGRKIKPTKFQRFQWIIKTTTHSCASSAE
jgi:hypothetical protein